MGDSSALPCTHASYRRSRRLFLRGLALVYACAFVSLWVQVEGLFGNDGIVPIGERLRSLARASESAGVGRWNNWPTLLWFAPSSWLDQSDALLHAICALGTAASVALFLGWLPAVSAAVAWALYLSVTVIGDPFLSFQWDILLIETGLLAVFYAPWRLRSSARTDDEPPAAARWLLWLLAWRLMFLSGLVKLSSGDATWSTGTALGYHYETQPLPTALAWHAHHLPAGVQRFSCWGMFAIELVVPFFLFGPRRVRPLAVAALVLLQVLIAATGNYGYFNLLTAVLCLSALEDRFLHRTARPADEARPCPRAQRIGAAVLFVPIAVLGVLHVVRAAGDWAENGDVAAFGREAQRVVAPWRIVNSYGLFRVMTTERAEIVIEGSADGTTWEAYGFRYKPQELAATPRWVAPHMPRLDWQMWFLPFPWFAGHSWQRHSPWFQSLLRRLLEGAPSVRALFAHDPFPKVPPRYVRARVSRYSFTTRAQRAQGGATWHESPYPDEQFVPAISLKP